MLDQEKVRLFADALIHSKAAEYKSPVISDSDLVHVLNGCDAALEDKRLPEEVPDRSDRTLMLYRFNVFLSRQAFFQLRLQKIFLGSTAGRLIATLVGLARNRLSAFPEDKRALASQMPDAIEKALGTSVETLALFPTAILAIANQMQSDLSSDAMMQFQRTVGDLDTRQGEAIKAIARRAQCEPGRLAFDEESLAQQLAFAHQSDVRACLRVYAAGITDLRMALRQREFATGPNGWRLSPLARYPIIKTRNIERYFVPNFRYLLRNFPDVAHFYLQPFLNLQDYDKYRGAVQEVYVAECVRDRLPALTVVPERRYHRPGATGVQGPDVTIVDRVDRSIIVVECKARRISVDTRVNLSDATLASSIDDVEKALLGDKKKTGLPKKVDELYARLPVYADVQGQIDATDKTRALCVVVLGETVAQYTKLIRARLAVSGGILGAFPYPFCIVDLETFEHAVEISIAKDISLAATLRQIWDESGYFELDGVIPEDFTRHEVPARAVFAESFMPAGWKEAKARASAAAVA